MVENFLQGDHILGFTVEVIAKGFPHGMGSDVLYAEHLGHLTQDHIGTLWILGAMG